MTYPTEPPREPFEVQEQAAPAPQRRTWAWWAALLFVIAVLLTQILAGIVAMIGVVIVELVRSREAAELWAMPVATCAGSLGFLGLLLLQHRRIDGAKPLWDSRDLKDWRSWGLAFVALVISAGANIARVFVERDPATPELNQQIVAMVENSPTTPYGPLFLLGLAVVILAPLTEEWLFRGILLPALQRALGPGRERLGAWVAVPVSSLIFGLLHWPIWWVPAVYGAVIGLISLRQRSLAMPMIVHVSINLTVFSLVLSSS